MKTHVSIIVLMFVALTFAGGQAPPESPIVPESDVSKTPEYRAAKAAEKKRDGAAMLTQAKILIERFPRSALAHKAMADAYFYMNFLDEAAAAAQKAIEISPKDPIAWRNLGHIRLKQNKRNDAEAAYKNAVNAAKGDATPWTDLAVYYSHQGNTTYALQCANYASNLLNTTTYNDHDGESPEAWTWAGVGEAFLTCKRPADAIKHFKRSIALQPDNDQIWLGLAYAYSAQGDRENSIAAAQQAVKLAPDSDDAKLALQSLTATQDEEQQPPQQQSLTLEQMQQIVDLMTKLQQLNNSQDQQYFDMIQQLQALKGSRSRARPKQTPEEANAWWQQYKQQQKLGQMQAEIDRLRQQQRR